MSATSVGCSSVAASGKPCKLKACRTDADGRPVCHLHDPNGKAAQVRREQREAAAGRPAGQPASLPQDESAARLAVSVAKAAELLDLSRRTVWAMIASGELASVRVRARVLVPMHALRELVGLEVA
jgi:excisionase family DNA binding protein